MKTAASVIAVALVAAGCCGTPQPVLKPRPAPPTQSAPFAALAGYYEGSDLPRDGTYMLRIEPSGEFTLKFSPAFFLNNVDTLGIGRVLRFDGKMGLVSASIEGGPAQELEIEQDENGLGWPVWESGEKAYLERK